MRVTTSVEPPGGKPTSTRIGARVGLRGGKARQDGEGNGQQPALETHLHLSNFGVRVRLF